MSDVFKEGYEAAKAGKSTKRNPYCAETYEFLDWLNGHTYRQLGL